MNNPPHAKASEAFVAIALAGNSFMNWSGAGLLGVLPDHYHLFRHSSATYYATKLNRQELCYRYGWKFSSNMPDVYISRAGMESKQLDEKFTQTELSIVKAELAQMVEAARIRDERIRQLEAIAEVLSLKPTPQELEHTLLKQGKNPLKPII